MATYMLQLRHETYTVTDDGRIGRPEIGMAPSGQWTFLGLVGRNNFGVRQYLPWAQVKERLTNGPAIDWLFKNGKPRYTGRDNDHGTIREWCGLGTSGVVRIWRVSP